MFSLSSHPQITKTFEGFCILKRNEKIISLYSFPPDFKIDTFYDLIFPCNCKRDTTEEYAIVTTNSLSYRSFVLCRYSVKYNVYLCIYSFNPWFEVLSKILLNLCSEGFLPDNYLKITKYLDTIWNLTDQGFVALPDISQDLTKDNPPHKVLKCSLRFPYIYEMYIKEYLTANKIAVQNDHDLWLEVFWSMLLERAVIFMSKRYQRLTSSMLAAVFFIHPLTWAYSFVSIVPSKNPQLLGMNCCILGIHNCMESIIAKTDFWNEALLVDLDNGETRMVGSSDDMKDTISRFKVPKAIKKVYQKHLIAIDETISKSVTQYKEKCFLNTVAVANLSEEETLYNSYKKGFHLYPLLFRSILIIIMGQYRQFFTLNEKVYHFNEEQYIISNSELCKFLKLFVNSQCFKMFIDEKLKKIQTGQDDTDRFDKERLEMDLTDKDILFSKVQKILKRKNQKGAQKNSYFYIDENYKSKTLTSSSTSVNEISSCMTETRKSSCDNISVKSESMVDEIMKALREKAASGAMGTGYDESTISSNRSTLTDATANKPQRPQNKTYLSREKCFKEGSVRNMIQKFNYMEQVKNDVVIRKASKSQSIPSETESEFSLYKTPRESPQKELKR